MNKVLIVRQGGIRGTRKFRVKDKKKQKKYLVLASRHNKDSFLQVYTVVRWEK